MSVLTIPYVSFQWKTVINPDQVNSDMTAIRDWANGNIDDANLLANGISDSKLKTGITGSKVINIPGANLNDGSIANAKITDGTINLDTKMFPIALDIGGVAPVLGGTISQLLGGIAYQIKAITGKTSWLTAPIQTLETVKTTADTDRNNFNTHNTDNIRHVLQVDKDLWNGHVAAVAPHSGHETPAGAQAKVDVHAIKTNNPHSVTATQTGAIVGLNDVTNPGGAVTLQGGTGITIATDTVGKKVTITATGVAVPGPHVHSTDEVNLMNVTGYIGTTLTNALNEIYTNKLRVIGGVY